MASKQVEQLATSEGEAKQENLCEAKKDSTISHPLRSNKTSEASLLRWEGPQLHKQAHIRIGNLSGIVAMLSMGSRTKSPKTSQQTTKVVV